ncbi:MAG TPA: hypothetical protein VIU61_07045, partial [Kofleriaceae bacterium]
FGISYGCDPARVDELVKATEDEIAAVLKNGVKPDILDRVKQTFLRERETQLRQNGFWSGWLVSAYRHGDDPALILETEPVVARMTSANVQAAAKRFLDPRRLYRAVMLPAAPGTNAAKPKPAAPKNPKGPKVVPGAEADPRTVPGAEKP